LIDDEDEGEEEDKERWKNSLEKNTWLICKQAQSLVVKY